MKHGVSKYRVLDVSILGPPLQIPVSVSVPPGLGNIFIVDLWPAASAIELEFLTERAIDIPYSWRLTRLRFPCLSSLLIPPCIALDGRGKKRDTKPCPTLDAGAGAGVFRTIFYSEMSIRFA